MESITVGTKKIFKEIRARFLPNLVTTTNPQIQEAQQTPGIRNIKRKNKIKQNQKPSLRHTTIKFLKIKRKIMKAAREKNTQYIQRNKE